MILIIKAFQFSTKDKIVCNSVCSRLILSFTFTKHAGTCMCEASIDLYRSYSNIREKQTTSFKIYSGYQCTQNGRQLGLKQSLQIFQSFKG